MIKKISILVAFLFVLSCNDQADIFEEDAIRGGFVQFSSGFNPDTRINLLNFSDYIFSDEVEDPNNNIISYNLSLTYGDIVVDDFIVITSFPAQLEFTGQQVSDALGIPFSEITADNTLDFLAIVTTDTGVFDARESNFNFDTNIQEGGNSAGGSRFLNASSGTPINQAMDFNFSFFIPPPKKIRGTSFEEPFASNDPSDDYIRPEGQDPNFTGELFNIDGLRHVMHVARGTGVDDEIGFRAEFIETTQSGFINEEIGVTKKVEDVGSYIDGEQGYQIEDVDGIFRLTFDRVEVPVAITTSGIRVQTFVRIRPEGYGGSDLINIFATIEKRDNTTETLDLLNINGSELDDLTGKWNLVDSGFLENIAAYTLVIETQVNSSSEEVYYDEVLIYQPDN